MISRLLGPTRTERASVSFHSLDPRRFWLDTDIGGATRSGTTVSPESALTLPAMFRALDNLCSHLAMLPIHVMERTGPKTVEPRPDHGVERLLNDECNEEMAAFNLRRSHHLHTMLWGNGRSEVERDTSGRPLAVWLLTPDRVTTKRDNSGKIIHAYTNLDGKSVDIPANDVIHTTNLSYDGLIGYRLIDRLARENVGLALAIESYAQEFFGNNTILGTVFEPTIPMAREVRADLEEKLKAKGAKKFGMAILPHGLKMTKMGAQNDQAQMIELMTFSVQDVSRWTNMPPPMLMELSRATFTNITEQGRWYIIYALNPWFKQYEQEFARKLFRPDERDRFFLRFVPEAFLRGDMEKRNAAHAQALQNGWRSIDEVRALEDLNPLPDELGAGYRVAVNTAPIESPVASGEPADQSSPPQPGAVAPDMESAFVALVADAASRVLAKEVKAVEALTKRHRDHIEFNVACATFFVAQEGYMLAALAPAMRVGFAMVGRKMNWKAAVTKEIASRCRATAEASSSGTLRDFWLESERSWSAGFASKLWSALRGSSDE